MMQMLRPAGRRLFARLRLFLFVISLGAAPALLITFESDGVAATKNKKSGEGVKGKAATTTKIGKSQGKSAKSTNGKAKAKGKTAKANKTSKSDKTSKASESKKSGKALIKKPNAAAKKLVAKTSSAKVGKAKTTSTKVGTTPKPAKVGKTKLSAKALPAAAASIDSKKDGPAETADVSALASQNGAAGPANAMNPSDFPVDNEDTQMEEPLESDDASTGPLFLVFVLAVLCIVAAFGYRRHKQKLQDLERPIDGGRADASLASGPEMAFSSTEMPSMSAMDSRPASTGPNETNPEGGGGKKGWKDRLFGSIQDKAKSTAAASKRTAVSAVAQGVGSVTGDLVGGGVAIIAGDEASGAIGAEAGGLVGDFAGSAASRATTEATTKAVANAITPVDMVGWDKLSAEEFWYRVYDVEDGAMQGTADLQAKLSRWNLTSLDQFERIKASYVDRHGNHSEFTQAMMTGRMRHAREKSATTATVTPPPAIGAPAKDSGPEPCTFERWVEIQVAESAWAQQGLDISANLHSNFNLSLTEWASHGAYWSPRYLANASLKKNFDRFERKYKIMYGTAA